MMRINSLGAFSTTAWPIILILLELSSRDGIKDNNNREEGIR
jgi:hypothetical protein